MKLIQYLGSLFAITGLAVGSIQAQPANDNFANAWTLVGPNVTTNGTTQLASKQTGEPNHGGNIGGRSVWFNWTAPANGLVQVDTVGSGFNTLLGVYRGTAVNALSLVVSNNDAPGIGNLSRVEFQPVQGTIYRIAVDAARNFQQFPPQGGPYVLNLTTFASVALTSPTEGAVFTAGEPIPLTAAAMTPNPPILRVDFYRGGNLFESSSAQPFQAVDNTAPAGSNAFHVVALDSAGLSWTSAVINVAVVNPGVTIMTPSDGANFVSTNPITVSAVGRLESGTITNIEFFVDGQKFGEDGNAPFSAVYSNVTGGQHRLVAVGRSDTGALHISEPVYIAVAQTLLARRSIWKYLDDGSDQGTNWYAPDFDDSAWASGPAQFGYGDGDEATVVSFGTNVSFKHITTYFRRSFTVSNASSYATLLVNVQRDDGAVVYLNGQESGRYNMNPGPVLFDTLAPNAQDDAVGFAPGTAPTNLLLEGTNSIAAEVHQTTPNSSDMSFDLEVLGLPIIIRNRLPDVALIQPPNNSHFVAPSEIALQATATDADGSVTKVEFFVDDVKLGEDTTSTYDFVWTNPAVGMHILHAVATDDLDGSQSSAGIAVAVYDAAATPLARVTAPPHGLVVEGPTNLVVTANASAIDGVTNVQFLANGVPFADDSLAPYSTLWSAPFGSNALTAVAFGANGMSGTSAVVGVIITIPPTNTVAPGIVSQNPVAGAHLTNLTTIQIQFSERISGVDASDLLLNGVPATNVIGSSSNYVFTFPQPAYGIVQVTWAQDHGIMDFGYPSNLLFDATAPTSTWSYNLIDRIIPVIASRTPPANAIVSNLTSVSVTFSETVAGVNASDLLINGSPALEMTGGGASYTFSFPQPPIGLISVTWDANHGIADLAVSPNPFNATGPGATWSYILDDRTVLVQTNSAWQFIKGLAEASDPTDAWRQPGFDDSGWSNALSPFYYGDPYNTPGNPGTQLTDMQNGYTSIYLRKTFNVVNVSLITNLFIVAQIDDGFVIWINGFEVTRLNVGGEAYNDVATATTQEQGNNGAPYTVFPLPDPTLYLVEGANTIAVHAFNQSLTQSSDFGFNAQLYTYLVDPSVVPPRVSAVTPTPGDVFYLTNITVRFSEAVSGVDAGDLLVNGVPAAGLISTTNTTYTFAFAQPDYGTLAVTWAANHGIADLDSPPKPFDQNAPGSSFSYSLVNPSAPTVLSQSPLAGSIVNHLPSMTFTQLTVTFNEAVALVDAADLVVSGVPASSVAANESGTAYTFGFAQPPYGLVTIGWAAGHGIRDLEPAQNPFDGLRAGNIWSYTLVDQVPPAILSVDPPPGLVTNLTSITVSFSEPVAGVNATDLRINGSGASGLSSNGASYTFTFPQPNATVVNVAWLNAHGIRDLAPVPNAFDAGAPNATWGYSTPDTLAPAVVSISPPGGVTVRSLNQITIIFAEPVTGVDTNDLLINDVNVRQVSGSGAGPYTFSFLPPSNGVVEVRWVQNHGIIDLASPPNAFAGGEWVYTLDPDAQFAGVVVISELMFNPSTGQPADEWLELHNVTTDLVNLTGWRFSRGIDFTFPNAAIGPGGYLIVAADVAAFQAKYPDVNNVVGGWTGQLANTDETLELETALGELVDSLHYATEGDWARRERGHGADRVDGITRSGATATVTLFDHRYTQNDHVIISGADQPEYNGRFVISGVTPSTFNINITGTPASPATGNIISRHALDDGFAGWGWFSAADGFGNSLELLNSRLSNDHGQNWAPSLVLDGTPGGANSTATNNIPPLLLDVTHTPAIPRSSNSVAITVRASDDLGAISDVTLFYRNHSTASPPAFSSTNMLDNGAQGDGVPGDGLFGAILPPAANGAIIEFYVQATDSTGLARTWPAPATDTNGVSGQLANALYQVDDEVITTAMPALRIVMTGTERGSFPANDRDSDAESNVTFISDDGDGVKIRYLCGVRIRGAGSRMQTPPNNRLNIPNDNRWNGMSAVNLNGQYVHSQVIGAAVAEKSGLMASPARIIQYRINGVNPAPITAPSGGGFGGGGAGYGAFVLVEPVNGDLADNLFPNDGDGNVYRASTGQHNANLEYQGTNASAYLQRGYFKTSNGSVNDWTDLLNLTFAFSQVPDPQDYIQAISTNLNVLMWMRYFAVGTLVNFGETSMFNGRGDDYALYRGMKDPRFVAIGHDFDTIFGQGDTTGSYATQPGSSIYIMLNPPNTGGNAPNMPLLRRFITNAAFAPVFFSELKRLTDTVFHPSQLDPLMDQMLTWPNGPTTVTIGNMKSFAANRRANVLSQIPLALTVNSSLSISNGLLFSPVPFALLHGTSHAIDTRSVLVNGAPANFTPWDARWTNTVALQPGINRILVQSLDSNAVEFARATIDISYDDASVQTVSGAIATDTLWTAAGGPYQVTANLTVNAGTTLTIQPGTTVYLGAGINITVANGGRILADGTDTARIRFASAPGGGQWGGITINGGASSPESRFAYAHFEGNSDTAIHAVDGTVFLDHLTFGNTAEQYVSLDRASFVVQDCVFPAATAQFELVHGSGGIKAGGRGIFLRNFFGKPVGYNDTIDFTGGNRPGPILQVINNVFVGTDDDILDFDSTDAWIERNIFLHVHRNGSPDSASAVSGGADNADTSQITMVGNLFYDVDHACNAKQGNFYTFVNNTVVRQSRVGGVDTDAGVITLADEGTAVGAGFYLEGNILYDIEKLVRLPGGVITFNNNIITRNQGEPWDGPGANNVDVDPLFKHVPQFDETTNFTSWASAQVLWDWFSLQSGSPAVGTGPLARDKGGVIPIGISIAGEPVGVTPFNGAVLQVGVNRTGDSIPTTAAAFPNGSGFTHYRWRLDGSAWSIETPTATPITLSGLTPGPHYVEVIGKRDSGYYQDDPVFGSDAVITLSRTWIVDPSASPLRLNEILADNNGSVPHAGTTPDVVELYNSSDLELDLTGARLTDDITDPDKFIFPAGSTIPARGYLVVYANNVDGSPGHHLGFGLNQNGDALYLFAAASSGGALLDSVTFGMQLQDLSVGRLADGSWALNQPTFGLPNRAAQVGDPRALRINEWLAIGTTPFDADFVELYNTSPLPIDLGGLYLTDEILGWPDRHRMPALSFIPGSGYVRLIADGNAAAGAEHLNFGLSGDQGAIGLFMPDLSVIDCVVYQPQRENISQGRSPNGSSRIAYFTTPTPGAPNPIVTGPPPFGGALVINEVLASNASLVEQDGRTPDWVELYNGTTNAIDLATLGLTDDTLQSHRFTFAPGVTIAPGAWLRVICDPNSTNTGPLINTNFALSASGGGVYLFDAPTNGGSLATSIIYGIQTANLSIGRVPDGGTNWVLTTPTPSAANTAVPTLGSADALKVNEWLANPPPGEDDWLEIYNPGPLPVALGGLHLSDNLNDRTKHEIAPLSFIGTGTNAFQTFIADRDLAAGADHVDFALSGSGDEAVAISTADGTLIDGYYFSGQTEDVSEGRFPDGATNIVRFPGTDSPGESNWRLLTDVAISEALSHTDDPLEDAIELQNLTASPIDVGGWWLSDDDASLRKYQIPSPTVVPAHGFVVIYETAFTNSETAAVPFAISSTGDEIVLSASSNSVLTGYRARVDFGPQHNAVSFGRYLTSDGRAEFVAMSSRSFGVDDPASVEEFRQGGGATNPYPRVGPIVISEVMYHPPDLAGLDNTRDEFIELRNITTAPVPLYDLAHPSNTWRLRDAVDFNFPPNTTIPGGGSLLVVSFDPINNNAALVAFRNQYNIPASQAILGPYSGRLANDTDDIELRRPDVPSSNAVPYVLVERVRYFDSFPWPMDADGSGFSLHRNVDDQFGNDPINWIASAPEPGEQASTDDFDGDGMPDWWENAHSLDRRNPNDSGLDLDNDGHTNLDEYRIGTDPREYASALRLLSIAPTLDGNNMVLSFRAMSNVSYALLWKELVSSPAWTKLASIAAGPERTETVVDPLPLAATRFYQLVTPEPPGEVNPMPAILQSPVSQSCYVDGQATFTVRAIGNGPLTYEWMFDGSAIENATNASFVLTGVQLSDIGQYSVTVRDANAGGAARAASSPPVPLSVAPKLLANPQSQSAPVGGAVTLVVEAEVFGQAHYRWRHNNRSIRGATNATLVLTNLQPSDAGEYTVFVAHDLPWGRFSVGSAVAVIEVTAPPIAHVVHISLDGLGAKYLEAFLANAPAQFPNFVRLVNEGAYTFNARCDYDISETIPNHACMFTGRPVLQPAGMPNTVHHGYNNNFPGATDTFHASGNSAVPYKASFFDVAHDHGLATAFYAGKNRLAICDRSYDAVNGALDAIGQDNGRDKIDFASVLEINGTSISNEVNLLVTNLAGLTPANYSFMHLAEPDITGHAQGWRSAAWSNAVRVVDQQLGRVLSAITTNPVIANRTALIVTADHGGGGVSATGHTEAYHITNYTIPFFLWGPGIPAGVDIYSLFSNRADPGTNRADYSVSPQPLRNADGGNLALALLGLPPIPGSFFQPELTLASPTVRLAVADDSEDDAGSSATAAGDGPVSLRIAALPVAAGVSPRTHMIYWPAGHIGYALEYTTNLASGLWQPAGPVVVLEGYATHSAATDGTARFYRLRKL